MGADEQIVGVVDAVLQHQAGAFRQGRNECGRFHKISSCC